MGKSSSWAGINIRRAYFVDAGVKVSLAVEGSLVNRCADLGFAGHVTG
jgi:hypothetical protein